ncbi:MAG: sulfotransferase [Gammaproteobacteria bacterium]|nr:sulfotransferase [Gammaproteobacteria bacterium]
MLRLWLESLWRFVAFSGRGLASAITGFRLKSLAAMLVFLPLFAVLQMLHWLGFLLDELCFPGYRKVPVNDPVFVLGVPRSGTTHLHRVLAADDRYTTFTTWECLFAPSIAERKLWSSLSRIDRLFGRPLHRLLGWITRRVSGGLKDVHAVDLKAPEEDYLVLLPVLACFILVIPFPSADFLWRMGLFDQGLPLPQRTRLMNYYRRCLQKHLYFHGADKHILSKNAAFASLSGSLLERFPGARVFCCWRSPLETVPSQLSSISGSAALFGHPVDGRFRSQMLDMLAFGYENLQRVGAAAAADRWVTLPMAALNQGLAATIAAAYQQLGLDMSEEFRMNLAALQRGASSYRSAHAYTAEQYGLTADEIQTRFAHAYDPPKLLSVV